MVWNITKDDIRVRMAVVEERTWAPPLVNKPELPQTDDTDKYTKEMGVPNDAMGYSDEIMGGRWGDVDEVLRGVYKEASEALGKEFEYPTTK
jgi:ribonuclease Z